MTATSCERGTLTGFTLHALLSFVFVDDELVIDTAQHVHRQTKAQALETDDHDCGRDALLERGSTMRFI